MSDLRRLVDGCEGGKSADLARELLRSAATDGPGGPHAKARTLRALGVASGVGIASTVTGAARAAATGIKAKVPLLVAKWIAVTAVVGGTAAVTYEATRPSTPPVEVAPPAETMAAALPKPATRPSHAPTPAVASSAEPPAPTRGEEQPRALAEPPPPLSPAPKPAAALLPATTSPRTPSPPASAPAPAIEAAPAAAPDPSPLAAEVASLESARAALASGRAGDALVALDRYGRDFPRGHLAPEAAVLRIQALAAAGDHARARTLADAFLRDHPDSPFAPRLRPYASAP